MIHDADVLDLLDALPSIAFDGETFRATRPGHDPLMASYAGGRWMPPDTASVLYTSLERDGALAEIAFHWSQATPLPRAPVALHRLAITTTRTLRLVRADLQTLGIPDAEYTAVNPARTRAIGAAIEFLGYDGLMAPSARWLCDNLVLFPGREGADVDLRHLYSETVDWRVWALENGYLPAG